MSRTVPLPKVPDKDTSKALTQVKNSVDALLRKVFPAGNLVQGTVVTSATQFTLTHGLGKAWTGYVVTRSYGAATGAITVYDGTVNPQPTKAINLIPSATGTIDVYVF